MSDMSDTNASPTISDNTGGAPDASPEFSEAFLEIVEGKNEDGTPKKRALSRDEALKLAQLGFGADSKFQEAAKTRDEALAIRQKMVQLSKIMQEDPFSVLQSFGKNPDEYVAAYFERKMQEDMIDPKDREIASYKKKLERYEAAQRQAEEARQAKIVEQRASELRTNLLSKIEQTLQSAGVPKTPRTIAEVARYMQSLSGKTVDGKPVDILNFPVEKIINYLQSTRKSEFSELFGALDEDGIINNMDEKLLEKFARAMSKKLGAQPIVPKKPKEETIFDGKRKEESVIEKHNARIKRLQAEWDRIHGKS